MAVVYHVILAVSGLSNHMTRKHSWELTPQSKFTTLIWVWGLMRWHVFSPAVLQGQCLFLALSLSCKDMGIWDRKEVTLPHSVNVWATGRAVRDCEEEVNGIYSVRSAWDLTGLNYGIWHWEAHISNCTTQEKEGFWCHTESASFWMMEKSTRLLTTGSKGFFWHLNTPQRSAV